LNLTCNITLGQPTVIPTAQPSVIPTAQPSLIPTAQPSLIPTAQPTTMPSNTPTVFQMTSIIPHEKISKGTITAVVVVIGLLLLGTIAGLYYKYEKKRKAWVRQKEAEEKWRDVYGRDDNVVNPINFEISKNFHDTTVDNFFGRSSEIALTNIIRSTDIENSNEVASATIDTASTTNTNLPSNNDSKFTTQQMKGYRPKVNILEKKLKKRANDQRLSAKSENT